MSGELLPLAETKLRKLFDFVVLQDQNTFCFINVLAHHDPWRG